MSSTRVIKVPDVGEGIAEVELVAWFVQPGDAVAEDQALADVMTDKASVEIPSPVAGRVLALGGAVGQMLAVGAELIRIETSDAAAAPMAGTPTEPVPAPAPAAPPVAQPAAVVATETPRAQAETSPTRTPADRPIASPALRRRAWELGIALKDLRPSGPGGRILQADLDAFVATGGPRIASAPAPAPAIGVERHDEQAIPVIGLRRRIAVQMLESKRRIPHFSYVEEVDVTEVEALRAALNAKWGVERGRLTLLPLLMRAIVLAVAEKSE